MERKKIIVAAIAAVCALLVGLPAAASIVFDQVAFHKATYTSYNDSSMTENGGTMFAYIRNNGSITEQITTVAINGTSLQTLRSNGTINWYRIYPSTIEPGGVAVVWAKATDNPLREGSTINVEAWTAASSYAASGNTALSTPLIRLGLVIPSKDRQTLYIYVRNTDTANSYRLDWVYLNGDVTSNCTFVGGNTVAPNSVGIIKVNMGYPVPIATRYACRLTTYRSGGGYYTVAAPVTVVDPYAPLGTWSSSMPTSLEGQRYARVLQIDTNYGTHDWANYNAQYNRYYIKTMANANIGDPSFPDINEIIANQYNPSLRFWYVRDEPDLNGKDPMDIAAQNQAYWDNDPSHPTFLNLCQSRKFNLYGHIPDIIGEDHYAMFSAPNCIANTWVFRYAYMEECWEFSEKLKENTEPKMMINWSQLAADGTWGTQPRTWGVDYQFWSNIMTGSKGVLWFKYGPGSETDSDTSAQIAEAVTLGKMFAQVRNLIMYSDVNPGQPQRSTTKVKGRVLVGEDEVVCILINNNYKVSGFWWSPSYSINTTTGTVTVSVPSWIPIQQVKQITPTGAVTPSYTVNGNQVTINFSTRYDGLVYVIGKNDTQAPDAPEGLKIAEDRGGGNLILTWKEAWDNWGTDRYVICRLRGGVLDVLDWYCRSMTYSVTGAQAGDQYYIHAMDSTGNGSGGSNVITY